MVKKNWQTEYEIMKIVANSKVLLEVLVWKYVMLSMRTFDNKTLEIERIIGTKSLKIYI